jgi:hypothetical protein
MVYFEEYDGEGFDEFNVKLVHETHKAILIKYGNRKIWLPKAELEEFDEFNHDPGDEITISVAEWLANIELN